MKPGIAGPWQARRRNALPHEERVRLSMQYTPNYSPRVDLEILPRTILLVLLGKGAYQAAFLERHYAATAFGGSNMTSALVVMPTYNEANNLLAIIPAILEQGDFHILVVDDNSPDGTGAVAHALTLAYPGRVFLMHRPGKLGLGTAYIAGFHYALTAGYDTVFEMDADFSHAPEDLPRLLDTVRAADIVVGSRYVSEGRVANWSLLRRAVSRGGSIYARLLLGLPLHDLTSGFKCFRRTALEELNLDHVRSNGYAFQIELIYRCYKAGMKIVEVPITFADRRVGQSKMSKMIVLEAMHIVWRLRWESLATQPHTALDPHAMHTAMTHRHSTGDGHH